MQNYLPFLIVVFLLTSCASNKPQTQTVVITEYAPIPRAYTVLPTMPKAPPSGTEITVAEAAEQASTLRTFACVLWSRYREVVRLASNGKTMMDEPTKDECPN